MVRSNSIRLILLVAFLSGGTACLEEESSLIPKIDDATAKLIAQPGTLDRTETQQKLQGRWKVHRAFRNGVPRVPEQGTKVDFSSTDFAITRPRSLELQHEYEVSDNADDVRISFSLMISEKARNVTPCEGVIKVIDGTALLLFREAEKSPPANFEHSDVGYLWVMKRRE